MTINSKRILSAITVALLITALTACGSSPQTETTAAPAETGSTAAAVTGAPAEPSKDSSAAEPESAEETSNVTETAAPEGESPALKAHSDVLVAFFSATGTTKGVAEKIAAVTGGDLYEILAAEPYSAEDLNYNDSSTRATKEQGDPSVRPAIGSEDISLAGYTTVYLGFPIWWGEEPRILDTFVEKYSFDGITVIPFCTSGGSGIGRSGSNMETLAGSGTWLKGARFDGNVSEAELMSWIEGLM